MVEAYLCYYMNKIDNSAEDYSTGLDLFSDEMRHLYDSGFTILTMRDLGYDENSNYLYIKSAELKRN